MSTKRPPAKNPRTFFTIEASSRAEPRWLNLGAIKVRYDFEDEVEAYNRIRKHAERYVKFTSGEWGIPSAIRGSAAKTNVLVILDFLRSTRRAKTTDFRAVYQDARYQRRPLHHSATHRRSPNQCATYTADDAELRLVVATK